MNRPTFWRLAALLLACGALLLPPESFGSSVELSPAAMKHWTDDNGNGTYSNPFFYGEFDDPNVIRVGDDYYLVGTTMHTVVP